MREMGSISMVNLRLQHERLQSELTEAMSRVVSSGAYINGPDVAAFESELSDYLGVSHAKGCANGTEALQIAIMALGLKPGDEIITTAFSFIASAEAAYICGVIPVFADVDEATFNISVESAERLITPRTKAIVPVHLFGNACDMQGIMDLARRHHLYVVEDVAQALGGYAVVDGVRRRLGTIGDVGCTSFFPTKNIGCMGDGGAIVTNSAELHKTIRAVANHGSLEKYHNEICGVNSRLDTIQAAILRVKLPHLDSYISHRCATAQRYSHWLSGVSGIVIPPIDESCTFNQYTIRVLGGMRDNLKDYLAQQGIATMVYYPLPLNKQKVFAGLNPNSCPVAERLSGEVLSLPISAELSFDDVDVISQAIMQWSKEN